MTDQHCKARIAVSDHAVLRYIVEGVRQRLLEKAQFNSPIMPKCIRHEDCVLLFRNGPDGTAVVATICPPDWKDERKRGGGYNRKIARRMLRKAGA